MITVFKYPVKVNDEFDLALPAGAHILTVQTQHGAPCMWALVDTEKPLETRYFRLAGTGHPIDQDISRYLGTFQLDGGSLVFDLFERPQ